MKVTVLMSRPPLPPSLPVYPLSCPLQRDGVSDQQHPRAQEQDERGREARLLPAAPQHLPRGREHRGGAQGHGHGERPGGGADGGQGPQVHGPARTHAAGEGRLPPTGYTLVDGYAARGQGKQGGEQENSRRACTWICYISRACIFTRE